MTHLKRKILTLTAICMLVLFSSTKAAEANYDVIPKPSKVEKTKGTFTLTENTKIIYPAGDEKMKRNAPQATYILNMK